MRVGEFRKTVLQDMAAAFKRLQTGEGGSLMHGIAQGLASVSHRQHAGLRNRASGKSGSSVGAGSKGESLGCEVASANDTTLFCFAGGSAVSSGIVLAVLLFNGCVLLLDKRSILREHMPVGAAALQ